MHVRNPYIQELIIRYELEHDVVDDISHSALGIMFKCLNTWTSLCDSPNIVFLIIILYGKDVELNSQPKEHIMHDFITLSEAIAVNCIGWRYDSIFVESTYNVERHIFDFQKMCHTLSGYTTVCDISFIDLYEKGFHNFQQVRIITPQKRTAIGKAFIEIGKYYCITIKACT